MLAQSDNYRYSGPTSLDGGRVATAEQLKALVKSHAAGDEERFRSIALQIAAAAAKKGNSELAQELRNLLDEARRVQAPAGVMARAVPIARPAGELAGLVTASFPHTRLSDMVLESTVRESLLEVVRQHRQRDRLRHHGLTPKRKILLVGPPGCGKTMSASALAGECGLPLMFVQLHSLITKYMGETAAKLHLVFDAMSQTRGVYLFDEFDAIGSTRSAKNDVGEIRRVLNSFLQFLERDDSESIVIAATNFVGMLDEALFRRFDDVIRYALPEADAIEHLVRNRLSSFDVKGLNWKAVTRHARGLSHAEITRACDDAAKSAVLSESTVIKTSVLSATLKSRKMMHPKRASRGTSAK
jgi:SpoVK/Ycf46/Vps4 family AAA+-type ATPase